MYELTCQVGFLRVYKDVEVGDELLVWYGEEYAEEMGIESEEQEDVKREELLEKCNTS